MRRSMGEKVFGVINTIFLLALVLVTLYPFYYLLIYSLNDGFDATRGGIYLFPREFTLANYQLVLSNPFIRSAYVVTIGRTLVGTVLGVAVTACCAYGLSFRDLPYKRWITVIILIPMLFSGGLIPYYLQLKALSLLNNFWVYILPSLFSIWNMFIMRNFFISVPDSLREAANIDGANHIQILVRVILPISLPMIAAISLFTGVYHWNEWFSGMFYVDKPSLIPMQTFLQKLMSANSLSAITGSSEMSEAQYRASQISKKVSLMSVKMSTVMVGTLPILCVYPFLQKYFVKGVMIGAVKE